MQAWQSFSYMFGPLTAFIGLGILILLLKWAFARGQSVVERPASRGSSDQYGLMRPIASPATMIEGEMLRRLLNDHGIRANLALTNDGPRVMVWPADVAQALDLMKKSR